MVSLGFILHDCAVDGLVAISLQLLEQHEDCCPLCHADLWIAAREARRVARTGVRWGAGDGPSCPPSET